MYIFHSHPLRDKILQKLWAVVRKETYCTAHTQNDLQWKNLQGLHRNFRNITFYFQKTAIQRSLFLAIFSSKYAQTSHDWCTKCSSCSYSNHPKVVTEVPNSTHGQMPVRQHRGRSEPDGWTLGWALFPFNRWKVSEVRQEIWAGSRSM